MRAPLPGDADNIIVVICTTRHKALVAHYQFNSVVSKVNDEGVALSLGPHTCVCFSWEGTDTGTLGCGRMTMGSRHTDRKRWIRLHHLLLDTSKLDEIPFRNLFLANMNKELLLRI